VFGELPRNAELAGWSDEITHHTFLHENVKSLMQGFRYDAHSMGMLVSVVAALSTFYPEASRVDDPEIRMEQVVRLIAKVPTIAAWSYRNSRGLPYVYPENDLGFVSNFLSMMFRIAEPKYLAEPALERALEVLFILHADHEQNCSANAMRSIGSSKVDPYSALAGAAAATECDAKTGALSARARAPRRRLAARACTGAPSGHASGPDRKTASLLSPACSSKPAEAAKVASLLSRIEILRADVALCWNCDRDLGFARPL
jgi:citrate synthase